MMLDESSPPRPDSAGQPSPTALERWLRPLVRFLQVESASGVVLLLGTVSALTLANSPGEAAFGQIWQNRVGFTIGTFVLMEPLLFWVNDGLMTIFFFVAGLEIKRELAAGELRDPRKAALPVLAALGGMLVPAAIYLFLRGGRPGHQGWGIPMATDIAFAVGFLALLGQRVPLGLKILLLSLAIADDIGAVLVIALFYSTNLSLTALGGAALGVGSILILNRIGVRRVPIYALAGIAIWLAFLQSGVHPTVAGVLLGLLTPAKSREAVSPLDRLEALLHPWVAFVIMPLFALANAGVRIEPEVIGHPVALAVALGLLLGKPLGVVLFSFLAVRLGLARLPAGVNWRIMVGAGCLAGIGFTMSLFITGLAFTGEMLDAGKIGTMTGSTLSAVLGCLLLMIFLPGRRPAPANPGDMKT